LARKANGGTAPEDVSDLIKGIDQAADLFVAELFENKNIQNFKELGDRLDGKPAQTISGDPEAPLSIQGLTVSLVPAKG